jgi:tetratricopeptide (TPR) repeat protein
MSARKTQFLLVAGALVLSVLLFMAPRIVPPSPESTSAGNDAQPSATIEVYAQMALKNAEPSQKRVLDEMLRAKQFDSIAMFWDRTRRPDLAAYFTEEKAELNGTAAHWFDAGKRYYYAVQFCQDKTEIPALYQCAMRCLDKSLEKDPANTEAKILLASCYVEGTAEPMKGITRLKEIEKTDSNNVQLQLSFAFFSLKSGQTDKAIQRFRKVLAIDSNYIAAYLHLADAYEQQGNTAETISMLEKYASRTNDITAKIEIGKYIDQLKTKQL